MQMSKRSHKIYLRKENIWSLEEKKKEREKEENIGRREMFSPEETKNGEGWEENIWPVRRHKRRKLFGHGGGKYLNIWPGGEVQK